MSMRLPSILRRSALLLAVAGCAPVASASSSDDSGGRLVVPLVLDGKDAVSTVFVTNHESFPVKAQVRYVGERSGPHPGLKVCGTLVLPAAARTTLDIRTLCGLSSPSGAGMVVLLEVDPGVVRLSAQARLDTVSPMTGRVLGTLALGGLPLGALDTTGNVHVVSGLRQNAPSAPPVLTDCYFGSLFDGSGFGGMVGRLELRDAQGQRLGSRLFALKPFELVALRDVFALVGAPAGPHGGAQARVVWSGGGDAVLGYCVASRAGVQKLERTLTLDIAQVADPNDEVRKRELVASETPGLGAFVLPPPLPFTQPRVFHGVYVRHPDRASCGVLPDDPNVSMVISAISPDGAVTVGGTSSRTPEFGDDARGAVNSGVADLWALKIEWAPGTSVFGGVKYRIDCRSGNGTSLADVLF
jgi:hypothetical protein